MKNRIIVLIIAILLFGCKSVHGEFNNIELLNWRYEDLKILDPIDAIEPDLDLIALYSRINDQSFQIRIDFLDLAIGSRKDIYIAIDTNPGGLAQIEVNKNDLMPVEINWDYLIKIPTSGNVVIMDDHLLPVYGMELLIVRDITQDRIVISFNKIILPISLGKTKMQVIITPLNQSIVSDKCDPFSIDGPSPASAKVFFSFWNTFSSTTPAQTLRSWAGAHAGPMSSRHGLKYLLDSADQTKSPVLLFDLLKPDTLSALDYLNVLPRIRKLIDQQILVLPTFGNVARSNMYSDLINPYLDNNPISNLNFKKIWNISGNLDMKMFTQKLDLYYLIDNCLFCIKWIGIFGVNDYAQYEEYINNCSLFPPNSNVTTIPSGFSIDCKKLLLTFAIKSPTTPLLFGGDFSNSILGDPVVSSEVFTYINEHPWIQILSINDLTTLSSIQFSSSLPNSSDQSITGDTSQQSNPLQKSDQSSVQSKIYEALIHSPKNQITELAWQVFYSLTQPSTLDEFKLRSNYVGQIGQLLTAAQWVDKPSPIEKCDLDLDYDGMNECILASNNIFIIIELEGGYIPFIFTLDRRGIHQIIGPTWEFTVGISDPSAWELSLGVRSDSDQILGAFSDSFHNWNKYSAELLNNIIKISNGKMTIRKSIAILPDSIHIEINNLTQPSFNAVIPLTVDPWLRYTLGWGDLYTSNTSTSGFKWGIISGETVEVQSTTHIHGFPFNATRAALAFPEDPNYDYSRGHYLPYPMALIEINSIENYSVDITINP